MQDVRYMLLEGSTFPCRDAIEAWPKTDVLRASGGLEVGIHRRLGDADRPLAYAADPVPTALLEPDRRARAATDTARAALVAVGDVPPSRPGRPNQHAAALQQQLSILLVLDSTAKQQPVGVQENYPWLMRPDPHAPEPPTQRWWPWPWSTPGFRCPATGPAAPSPPRKSAWTPDAASGLDDALAPARQQLGHRTDLLRHVRLRASPHGRRRRDPPARTRARNFSRADAVGRRCTACTCRRPHGHAPPFLCRDVR
jgi:hypothetical protein